ncbi:MAG TPA: hypothetical protein VKR42_01855 [Ktedonobacteraceae bacterium]|nr:hypothetical protein [Ktedonobacteraceae bacterium]
MRNKLIIFAILALQVLVIGSTAGTALSFPTDVGDNFTKTKQAFTANLKQGENLTVTDTINGATLAITCKVLTVKGTTPNAGLGFFTLTGVVLGTCSWTLNGGGGGLVIPSVKAGWELQVDDQTEMNDEETFGPGDVLKVKIPEDGATLTLLSSQNCIVKLTAQTVKAKTFNDQKGVIDFNEDAIKFIANGGFCGSDFNGNGKLSATLVATYTNTGALADTG